MALSTPSLESKDPTGACHRVEWNLDHFSSDVLYYEWSYNEMKDQCEAEMFL
jgi:hypothetical protein